MANKIQSDCKVIHDSWGMLSTLVRTLVAKITVNERREIRETYKAMYGEDLLSHLQRVKMIMLSGKNNNNNNKNNNNDDQVKDCCEGLILWMVDPCEREACLARDALDKNEADFNALLEMFVGRKSSHVIMIKQSYQTMFKTQLDHDIASLEPPHPCQRILVALSTSHKSHHADVSEDIAKCDAIRLYQTGEGNSGTINEAVVLEILSKRSIPQLKLTFCCYKRIYGHSFTKQLKKVDSTQFEDAITTLVQCIVDPSKYYAKMLERSLKGGEAKKGTLTRVMVSRAEVDMRDIQRVFKKKYGLELKDAICQYIQAGDYRGFLLALANNNASSISYHY